MFKNLTEVLVLVSFAFFIPSFSSAISEDTSPHSCLGKNNDIIGKGFINGGDSICGDCFIINSGRINGDIRLGIIITVAHIIYFGNMKVCVPGKVAMERKGAGNFFLR